MSKKIFQLNIFPFIYGCYAYNAIKDLKAYFLNGVQSETYAMLLFFEVVRSKMLQLQAGLRLDWCIQVQVATPKWAELKVTIPSISVASAKFHKISGRELLICQCVEQCEFLQNVLHFLKFCLCLAHLDTLPF